MNSQNTDIDNNISKHRLIQLLFKILALFIYPIATLFILAALISLFTTLIDINYYISSNMIDLLWDFEKESRFSRYSTYDRVCETCTLLICLFQLYYLFTNIINIQTFIFIKKRLAKTFSF